MTRRKMKTSQGKLDEVMADNAEELYYRQRDRDPRGYRGHRGKQPTKYAKGWDHWQACEAKKKKKRKND